QRVRPTGNNGSTYQLIFTGPNAAGAVVSLNTASITHNSGNPIQEAIDIQNALNALANIGGVGGAVSVTPPAAGGTDFTVVFGGTLSQVNVQQMTKIGPVTVTTVRNGGGGLVVNGTGGNVGVWRFTNGNWFNLTAV